MQYPSGPQGAMVHTGFYETYQSVSSQVIDAVNKTLQKYPNAHIVINGHSLGSALATFAALDIKEKLNPPNQFTFYSFGAPRIGNQNMSDYIFSYFPSEGKTTYYRILNQNDIFGHTPPSEMGFHHVGDEVWYNDPTDMESYQLCHNRPG
jgi:predicted lipase